MTASRKAALAAWGSIILAALAVYAGSFHASFHFDDFYSIVENDRIKNIRDLRSILGFVPSRPLVFLTFALNYHLGRLDTFGYHIVNVLFHMGAGLLVYAVSVKLFGIQTARRTPSLARALESRWPALFPALIFIAHPMQTEAVTYIIQRVTVMCAFFYLLAVYLFMKAGEDRRRPQWWLTGSAASYILSSFCKEEAATLPAVLLLYEYVFVAEGNMTSLRKHAWRHVPFWFLLALFFIYRYSLIGTIVNPVKPFAVSTYVITELTVILKYIQLLLLPVNQNVDHDYPAFSTLVSFWPLISMAFHLTVIAWAIRNVRSEKVLSFSILWFYITLTPTSSIVPLQDFMAEHRVYLPSMGFCIVLGVMLTRAAQSVRVKWRFGPLDPAKARV